MSLPAIAAAWAISLLLALAGGWRLGVDHMKASASDIEAARVATREAAQQGAADAISKIEVRNVTVRQALARLLCSCSTVQPVASQSSPLVVASCPPPPSLADDSFGAWVAYAVEITGQYVKCRAALEQ